MGRMKSDSDNVRSPPGGRRSSSNETKLKNVPKSSDLLALFLVDLKLRRLSEGSIELWAAGLGSICDGARAEI